MLALDRSLLNREYILMNVLKALASINSMCNLHVIFLSNITPRYSILFTIGIFRPFNVRREAGGYFLLHNIYKFSSYLTGNTIHLCSVARNSDH
jgi:hypothetical protein